jgi:hypothetical protein
MLGFLPSSPLQGTMAIYAPNSGKKKILHDIKKISLSLIKFISELGKSLSICNFFFILALIFELLHLNLFSFKISL